MASTSGDKGFNTTKSFNYRFAKMIIDTFMFFNELDILEIRLRELWDVVDVFVLLECGEALSGVQKPLIFEEHKQRFERFLPHIRHIKLRGLPPLVKDTEGNRFWLERFQRDALMLGLVGHGLQQDDLVLLSDVDEIPKASAVREVSVSITFDEVWLFKQKVYYRYFDHLPQRSPDLKWLGTVAVRYNAFSNILPHDLRRRWAKAGEYWTPAHEMDHTRRFVEDGGWHLTYFGSKAAYDYKTANFAHGANGGVGGTYGDPNTVAPATISREETVGIKPFDNGVRAFLMRYIQNDLSGEVPRTITTDLPMFYHLFESSKHKR
jgi:beta-1,4-mannosyl-glycoprotein beta-1,4-N-acetylglucosaminyltransferase